MGLFTQKSKKDKAIHYATAAVSRAATKRALTWVGSAIAGLAAVTAASAAISAARHQAQS